MTGEEWYDLSDKSGLSGQGGVEMTDEAIEAYLLSLGLRGRTEGTLQSYRNRLHMLRSSLGEDRLLDRDTLAGWRDGLLEAGYSHGTVNAALSVVNGFLAFVGRRELQLERDRALPEAAAPELTREEYIRLLQAARHLGRERAYMLTKVFATTGLTVLELPRLTARAVREGRVETFPSGTRRLTYIPRCLRDELLGYALRAGSGEGPIFITRSGRPLGRTYVSDCIRALSGPAGVRAEKCNPRSLRRLYQATRTDLEDGAAALLARAYDHMLESEQLSVGWDSRQSGSEQSARVGEY